MQTAGTTHINTSDNIPNPDQLDVAERIVREPIRLPKANEVEVEWDIPHSVCFGSDYEPGENAPAPASREKPDFRITASGFADYDAGSGPAVETTVKVDVMPGPPSKIPRAFYRRRNKIFECLVPGCGLQVKNGIMGMQWHMKRHIRLGEAVGPMEEADVNDLPRNHNGGVELDS